MNVVEVVVGFDPTEYEVDEDDGSVTLTVHLISGVLERNVTVFFQTGPGNATSAGTSNLIITIYNLIYY